MEFTTEKLKHSEILYTGKVFTIKRDIVSIDNSSKDHTREVVMHNGGVVVAPILDNGDLVMIKQWRYSINEVLIEFPAGKLGQGEDPFDAIQRELQEETGYSAKNWEFLSSIYPAPGFCTEKLYLYKATGLSDGSQSLDEGEMLYPFTISPQKAWDLVKQRKITDGKTIALLALIQPTHE